MGGEPINFAPSRIAGFDLARAIALLGMVFVNFKYLMKADDFEYPWLLWLSDWLDGRPAATFVILAGIGKYFASNERQEPRIPIIIKNRN